MVTLKHEACGFEVSSSEALDAQELYDEHLCLTVDNTPAPGWHHVLNIVATAALVLTAVVVAFILH